MSPEDKAGSYSCEVFSQEYFDTIQRSIRESSPVRGYLPQKKEKIINNALASYINSGNYQKDLDQLYDSSKWLEPDKDKFETSFQSGLFANLKYSLSSPNLLKIPSQHVVRSFVDYCHQTVTSLNQCIAIKNDRQPEILHLIIKSPRLFTPTIFEELWAEIPHNPLLSLATIKSLMRDKTPNISQVIAQKTEIFQKLLSDPEVSRLRLNLKRLQLIVIKQADPEKFIQEHYLGHPKKDIEVKPRSATYTENDRKITRIGIEKLIGKILSARKKVDVLQQHRCHPEKLAELLAQIQELSNDVSNLISLNDTKPELKPRQKKKPLTPEPDIQLKLPNFKHQAFLQDPIIKPSIENSNGDNSKRITTLWKRFLCLKRLTHDQRLFDSPALKYLTVTDPEISPVQLTEMDSLYQKLGHLYQSNKKSYFTKGYFLKTAILFHRSENKIKEFIGNTYESLQSLEPEFSSEKNQFVNGKLTILLHYLSKYPESARHQLTADTSAYHQLSQKFGGDQILYQLTPELGNNILRYAVIQKHTDQSQFVNQGKSIYSELKQKYQGNPILEEYLPEALLIASFFFQEKAEEYLDGLTKRVTYHQAKYPNLPKQTIIETVIRFPDTYLPRLKSKDHDPSKESYHPKQTSLEYFLYKLQLQSESGQTKTKSHLSHRFSLDPLTN